MITVISIWSHETWEWNYVVIVVSSEKCILYTVIVVKATQRKLLYLTMAALTDAFGGRKIVKDTRCVKWFENKATIFGLRNFMSSGQYMSVWRSVYLRETKWVISHNILVLKDNELLLMLQGFWLCEILTSHQILTGYLKFVQEGILQEYK